MAYYILKSYKLKVDPFRIFEALNTQKNCFFLDSSLNGNYSSGRHSFLGINPFFILETKREDPFPKIRQGLAKYRISGFNPALPFCGGLVGYLAYDLGVTLEKKIARKVRGDLGIPDCFLGFYNTVIIIDRLKRLLYILALGFPETKMHLAEPLARENFRKVYSLLSKADFAGSCRHPDKQPARLAPRLESDFNKEDYLLAINQAKEYIRKGDIYQVNLSQRFRAKSTLPALRIYQSLRSISPANFNAYLDGGGFQILSSSPEEFLRLDGNLVTSRPMKGTRPRSGNKKQDAFLRKELLKSPKDRAELVMIVDLVRNDLGRVCSYDSIKVAALRILEEYSTVFQTTATVEGLLHKDKDGVDLLRACFPGGSITGCPKIRAMEIIQELEPTPRGVYTGCLGYLSFSGNMNFNMLIRTILKQKDQLHFGVGGGIVADSQPEAEYQETLVKAKAILKAIGAA